MEMGSKIRELRTSKGLTQKELSVLSGVAEISIRQYENNKRQPKVELLQKIANALDVPINDLLNSEVNGDNALLKFLIDEGSYKSTAKLAELLGISVPALMIGCLKQGVESTRAMIAGEKPELKFMELQEFLDRNQPKEEQNEKNEE